MLSNQFKSAGECDLSVQQKEFIEQGKLIFALNGKNIFALEEKVLKIISLSASQGEQVSKRVIKEASFLQNEFYISQMIQNFKCIHTQQMLQDGEEINCMQEESIQEDDNIQGENSTCQFCFGQLNILKPISFQKSSDNCFLLSPYANCFDAFQHLYVRFKGIFKYIDDDFDKGTLNYKQNCYLTKVRYILFGAMKMTFQIGAALAHLHEDLNIAHNDLKPDNFFAHYGEHCLLPGSRELFLKAPCLDDDCVAYYLGDFGFSKKVGFESQKEGKTFYSMKKETYLAPEILEWLGGSEVDQNQVEKPADIFALGVSLFQVLFQDNPFQSTPLELIQMDKLWLRFSKQLRVYEKMTDIVSMKDLLEGMLARDPKCRLNIKEVLNHPWLVNIKEYLLN